MSLSRSQKEQEVASFRERCESAETMVVVHNNGLTVAEMTDLRNQLRKEGASFKVTKNTLVRLALPGTKFEKTADLFTGPTGVAVSQDPVTAAKVVYGFAKKNDRLAILGGAMGTNVLDAAGVEKLAKMPSLDEVRATLVGLLQAPATKVARVVQAPPAQLARVVGAYAEKG